MSEGAKRLLKFATVAGMAMVHTAASADQVRFTGQTRADGVLAKDILQNVLRYAFATDKCSSLTEVEASTLSGYQPADTRYRVGKGTIIYERWTATLCGKKVKFLVSYWPVESGGSDFALGVPYPADAP